MNFTIPSKIRVVFYAVGFGVLVVLAGVWLAFTGVGRPVPEIVKMISYGWMPVSAALHGLAFGHVPDWRIAAANPVEAVAAATATPGA